MRKPYVAGNWKMNMDAAGAVALAAGIAKGAGTEGIDIGVAPPSVCLALVAMTVRGSGLHIIAQNTHYEPNGAFTGEISPAMALDAGCDTVIVGHSERRHIFGESDELINQKVSAVLGKDMTVILCIGETLDERQAGRTQAVCERHVRSGLQGIGPEQMANVVIAYEPVWAIGTGHTASPEQAQEVHGFLRPLVAELYGGQVADAVRIQYGGSVKPDNTFDLMSQPDVDGALVGGASLKVDSFLTIVSETRRAKGLA